MGRLNYWQHNRLSRRRLLRTAAASGLGLATAAALGCGEGEQAAQTPAPTTTQAAQATGTTTTRPMNVGSLQLQGEPFSLEWWQSFPVSIPEPPGTPKRGGTAKLRYISDIPHADPTFTAAYLQAGVYNFIYNRPLHYKVGPHGRYDGIDLDPKRGLAQSVEVTDDGVTYILKFKQGIKWHNLPPLNGRAFTAEDVRWTYDHYMNEPGSVETAFFADVEKLEVVDTSTLKITLKERNADFLFSLASPYIPILPREVYERDGDFRKTLVGTGPFQLKEWTRDSRWVLERNPEYTVNKGPNGEQLPYLDSIELLVIPDNSTGAAAFRAGELAESHHSGITLEDLVSLFRSQPELMAQRGVSRGSAGFFFLPIWEKPFDDVRVRRAFSIAFDQAKAWQTVSPKSGTLVPGWMYWYFMGRDKPLTLEEMGPWYNFDAERAKQLMKEAGFEEGFSVAMSRYSAFSASMFDLAVQFWGQVLDIKITPKIEDYTAHWAKVTKKRWSGEIINGSVNLGFSLDEITRQHLQSGAARNYIDVSDSVLDDLVIRQKAEFDDAKRQEMARQIAERYYDQVYSIWTPSGAYGIAAWPAHVRNYRYWYPWISPRYSDDQFEEVWLDV